MIKVENLIKQFGDVRAVDGLSFELFEGEILGFLGPNGAGKTTTMRILTCFFPPTSGRASVAGFDVMREPDEVRRVIGYMPEGVPLYREMPVTDYLDFIAHAKGIKRRARKKFIDSAIEETNLGDVRRRTIGHLSKGYRQRVGLAQAILGEPKILILDEPTAGLDPKQIAEVRGLVRSMAGRRTVILSTHILPEVQMTCSRVVIINKGKIAASGTPEKLTTRLQNRFEYVIRLIGPADQAIAAFTDLTGVQKVEQKPLSDRSGAEVRGLPGDPVEIHVTVGIDTADLRPVLARIAVQKGWHVIELHQVGLSLEEVFLRVVSGETADGAPASRGSAAGTTGTTGSSERLYAPKPSAPSPAEPDVSPAQTKSEVASAIGSGTSDVATQIETASATLPDPDSSEAAIAGASASAAPGESSSGRSTPDV